ncbi:glycosyltransferase family 4 protein [Sphingomonas sp. KC8]|uniref:glycosyltransferase family 4 protein n=1 Tax=Sphingomonas sp. KC8 TaxID=1030157 RepID=UPI0002488A67|nr:group 1 glycosyl transferase [Sphingomonas sp. KC8]
MKQRHSFSRADRADWPAAILGLSSPDCPPTERPLRVALFSGNYNCIRDGANQALNRLVAFLQAEAGACVRVYSPTVANPAFEPAGDLVSVPSFGIPGRREYRLAMGLPDAVRDDVRAFAPDIIHLSAPDILGRSAQRFARQLGVPVVTSLHTRFETYLEHYGLRFLKRRIERYLGKFYEGSDHVLVPNTMIADEMRDAGLRTDISVWGRGVDRTLFTPGARDLDWRRSHGYADDDVVVLFFGRLVREKGLDVFADVIDAARAMGCRLRPLVVGDGPGRGEFARRLANVNFVGHLAGAELGRAVASADILLNPSTTEAFGNVTLEAMAAGLAIVSADVPSARSLVDNGRTGLLVPASDVRAYAAAIERLIRVPMDRVRLAKAAVAEARRYEWNATLQAVVDAYLLCLAGDRPGP